MGVEMEMEADPNTPTTPDDASGEAKACADCHTTTLARRTRGAQGLSICNACGIPYRKRRRQALGIAADPQQQDEHKTADPQEEDQHQQQPKKKAAASSSSSATTTNKEKKADKDKGDKKKKDRQVTVELCVVGFGKEAVMLKQRRKKCMSEEERAAVFLMALSSGVIYAS